MASRNVSKTLIVTAEVWSWTRGKFWKKCSDCTVFYFSEV